MSWSPKAISSLSWSSISFGINFDPGLISFRIISDPIWTFDDWRIDVGDQTMNVDEGNIREVMSKLKKEEINKKNLK